MSRFGFSKSIKNPSGSWSYEQLIGAKVRVVSTSVSNMFRSFDCNDISTISKIDFRISTDGKVIPIVILSEYPDKAFTCRDIAVIELCNDYQYDAVCGKFMSGQSLVGLNVDTSLTVDEESGDLGGGISLIDDKGNVITNRYVRFVGADIEDLTTDKDNITDINISLDGDILD